MPVQKAVKDGVIAQLSTVSPTTSTASVVNSYVNYINSRRVAQAVVYSSLSSSSSSGALPDTASAASCHAWCVCAYVCACACEGRHDWRWHDAAGPHSTRTDARAHAAGITAVRTQETVEVMTRPAAAQGWCSSVNCPRRTVVSGRSGHGKHETQDTASIRGQKGGRERRRPEARGRQVARATERESAMKGRGGTQQTACGGLETGGAGGMAPGGTRGPGPIHT